MGIIKGRKNIIIVLLGIIILALGYLFLSNGNFDDNTEKIDELTSKQWIADVDYLYSELPKNHKNLYYSMSKEKFEKEIEMLKADIPNLKGDEIKIRMAQIVALAKDAHTAVKFNFDNQNKPVYPIKLKWYGNDLRVVSAEKDKKHILGSKVVAINNIHIEEVINKVNSLISHENNQWLRARNTRYIIMPEVLKRLNITQDDKIEISLEGEGKNIKIVELEPKLISMDNSINIENEIINKPLTLQGKDTMPDKAYWYKYLPENKILYLQYNECIDYGVAKMYGLKNYMEYPKFSDFSRGFLEKLKNNDVDKLIVDLRYNGGGNSSLMSELVSELRSIKSLKGEGKVVVLIGKSTFSSAIINTLDFKNQLNAILVGEETGGNANSYGEVKEMTLPNSNIKVKYSTRYFELSEKYKDGILPDISIEENFDHYKKGIDDVYEAAKNYKVKN